MCATNYFNRKSLNGATGLLVDWLMLINPEVAGESCPEMMQLLFDDVSTAEDQSGWNNFYVF